jgi:hypothetical protein
MFGALPENKFLTLLDLELLGPVNGARSGGHGERENYRPYHPEHATKSSHIG